MPTVLKSGSLSTAWDPQGLPKHGQGLLYILSRQLEPSIQGRQLDPTSPTSWYVTAYRRNVNRNVITSGTILWGNRDIPQYTIKVRGHVVAQLVDELRYKTEGRGFDSRWCHWNFFLTLFFRPHYGPGVDSASNRNEYQKYFLGG